MPRQIREAKRLTITERQFPNKGIADWEGEKVIVKHTLPGQTVEACLKRKKKAWEGINAVVVEKAPYEIEPACAAHGVCGGCAFQQIPYEKELALKEEMALAALQREGVSGFSYQGILPSPQTIGYRNKMEFAFGDTGKDGALALGIRKRDSFYEVVTPYGCTIIDEDFRKILLYTLEFFQNQGMLFYHRRSHEGCLRHLVIRKGEFTGELLVCLVTASDLGPLAAQWAQGLQALALGKRIVGAAQVVNPSVSDVISYEDTLVLYGELVFTERILGLTFTITPTSFFQTNSAGAETLYGKVREYVGDARGKTVYDLYCGTGTIGQIVARGAERVIGVELVEPAVRAAEENARKNGIANCRFVAGDVLRLADTFTEKPDIVVLDPPREGIHPKAIDKIIALGARKVVYVSCMPTTLARDLKIWENNGYRAEKLAFVDMFPRTGHMETVVSLSVR